MTQTVFDTSILIDIERKVPETLARLEELRKNHPLAPRIAYATYFEYYYGVLKTDSEIALEALEKYDVIESTPHSNRLVAEIRLDLERKGMSISASDILIAAATIAENGVLITKAEHFERIEKLSSVII